MRRGTRRLLALTVTAAMLGTLTLNSPMLRPSDAHAATMSRLARAKQQERLIGHRISRIRRTIAKRNRRLSRHIPERPSSVRSERTRTMSTELQGQLRRSHLRAIHRWQQLSQAMERRVHRFDRRRRRRARELALQRSYIRAWVAKWGVFQTCPVRGYHQVTNSFGVMVRISGVPVHIHQGDDILSSFGTPIVAPFSGNAVASWSDLGGMAVKVYGDRGYVYNAHLERYGTLGHVSAGTVVGYVGSTGDASSPHDHFEWHPGNGPAVDPYPYLSVVC